MSKTSQDEVPGEFQALERDIQGLLLQKAELSRNAELLISKRREFLKRARELTLEIRRERNGQNATRSEVGVLKNEVGEIKGKMRELRVRIRKAKTRVLDMERKVDEDEDHVSKRLKDLEWRLQAEPLTKEKEKKLVEEIAKLEVMSLLWKRINEVNGPIRSDSEELEKLESLLTSKEEAREEVSWKVEEGNRDLSSKIREREEVFQAVEEINRDIAECGKKIAEVQGMLAPLLQAKREFLRKGREEEEGRRERVREELLRKAVEAAREKVKTGKKMNFEELKLLYDHGTREGNR